MLYDHQHKNEKGLNKILSYKASMGKGLSKLLLSIFPPSAQQPQSSLQSKEDAEEFFSSNFEYSKLRRKK